MAKGKGEFKNTKLGKNVYRQLKRRGPPQPIPTKHQSPKPQRPEKPTNAATPSPARGGIVGPFPRTGLELSRCAADASRVLQWCCHVR
jgi:hypothetical protein